MRKFTLFLMTAMLSMVSATMMAGGTKYYFKVTATATPSGAGLVYASNTEEPTDDSYTEESVVTFNSSSKDSYCNLYAKPAEGFRFLGWATEADATSYLSTDVHFQPEMNSSAVAEEAAAEFQYYAIFGSADAAYLHYPVDHIFMNKDENATNELLQENLTEAISYTSSNTAVATISEEGEVTGVGAGSAVITAAANGAESTYVVTVIDNSEAGLTQIGNGDFENWSTVSDNNHAPFNWNSFETAEGTFASMVSAQQVEMSTDHRPGSNGLYSARIYSRNVMGIATAQGNLTTGCINAGAMSATDGANHNLSKTEDESKSETISKVPSHIRAWVKFIPGKANEAHPNARIAAIVHDAYNYVTFATEDSNTDENKSHAIAIAELNFPACEEWTELKVPFEFTETWADETGSDQWYILINLSTNSDPGEGQVGDVLYIDDVELVYEKDMIPTAIANVKSEVNGTNAIYNVAGQQMPALGKGINIVRQNGKTVKVIK